MIRKEKNYLVKKVKLSDCFLRNKKINIKAQKQSTLYKQVLESIKEKGLINPLTVVMDNDKYKVCIGNNRYLACEELKIEYVDIIIAKNEEPLELKKYYKYYEKVLKNESPYIK